MSWFQGISAEDLSRLTHTGSRLYYAEEIWGKGKPLQFRMRLNLNLLMLLCYTKKNMKFIIHKLCTLFHVGIFLTFAEGFFLLSMLNSKWTRFPSFEDKSNVKDKCSKDNGHLTTFQNFQKINGKIHFYQIYFFSHWESTLHWSFVARLVVKVANNILWSSPY